MTDEPRFDTEGDIREFLEENPEKAVELEEPWGSVFLFIEDGLTVQNELGDELSTKGDDFEIVSESSVSSKTDALAEIEAEA